jgi:hypothetical protein
MMISRPRIGTVKTLATVAIVSMFVLGGGVSSASAADTNLSAVALAKFRANLTLAPDIAKFDALTSSQQQSLASYLLGETDPFAELSSSTPSAVGFEKRTDSASTITQFNAATSAATAASATRTVSAWESFLFAGITISKTTVSETYHYSGAKATSIAAYSCVVNANYDPFSSITDSKSGAYVSSSKATAECLVSVKRGVPTPWGPIAWSTASNIQFVTGTGSGAVSSHGWR